MPLYGFVATYADPNGVAAIANAMLRISDGDIDVHSLYVQYSTSQNKFFVLLEPGPNKRYDECAPGSAKAIASPAGTLYCSQSRVEVINGTLVITLSLSAGPTLVGRHAIYQIVRSRSGCETDFVQVGSWAVASQ